MGVVKKTRIKAFDELESFPFAYETFAQKYGKVILEKEAEVQRLASPDQVARLTHLIALLKIEEATVNKWLEKAQASDLAEMEEHQITACIAALEKKLTPEAPILKEVANA
jgi:hypothetical protein